MAGLAAAHRLLEASRARGTEVDVLLLEASDRLGGVVGTERTDGFTIERGADAMLREKPWGVALCGRLGMAERLIGTRESARRTFVAHTRRLEPLPEGFLLLAPTLLRPLVASRLFSWRGKLRMALDLVLPRGTEADESLAAFVRRRLGREALERAAQPLAGGIYTADPERLSLAATMPRLKELERRHRSLILGLRATAGASSTAAGARYGLFTAPADGMGALVDALAARLPEGAVRLRAPVTALARDGSRWRVAAGDASCEADAVVLAAPAHATAPLLAPLDEHLGRLLAGIEYASSATVTLAYPATVVPALRGAGFVVPAVERNPLLACTYTSRKFEGRAPEGFELLRAFVGGALRPDLATLEERPLVATVRQALYALLGLAGIPELVRVHRHARAMPQYALGHLERVAALEARAAALPSLALAGAAYRGIGVPDCIHSGERAAESLL